jgi:predicted enzyme related to lactoylglutathione lyase
MTTPRLYRIILPVSDIEKAAQFYGAVLESVGERVSPGRHYFDCGGTILACYDPQADGDPMGEGWQFHQNQYLYFSVADLQAVYGRIESAGGRILSDVESMPWGERMFYAEDPFGGRISFVEAGTLFTGSA